MEVKILSDERCFKIFKLCGISGPKVAADVEEIRTELEAKGQRGKVLIVPSPYKEEITQSLKRTRKKLPKNVFLLSIPDFLGGAEGEDIASVISKTLGVKVDIESLAGKGGVSGGR